MSFRVSLTQIRRHEQSLHASHERMRDDLKQLMVNYQQRRAEVLKELSQMRREMKQAELHDTMQYIKSPYRYEKHKQKQRHNVNRDLQYHHQHQQQRVPEKHALQLAFTEDKKEDRKEEKKIMKPRFIATKLPALNVTDIESLSPRRLKTKPLTDLETKDKINIDNHKKKTRKNGTIDAPKCFKDEENIQRTLTYHLPSLNPIDEPKVTYSMKNTTKKQRKYNTQTLHASMLPPLTEQSEQRLIEGLPYTTTTAKTTTTTTATNTTTSNVAEKDPITAHSMLRPIPTHRAIIRNQKPKTNSDSSGNSSTVSEKKNVRFAPDVIDYNRESKPSYRRKTEHSNQMRVMELVVHCHNSEPLDQLPNVVERYMLRAVPKINV